MVSAGYDGRRRSLHALADLALPLMRAGRDPGPAGPCLTLSDAPGGKPT
jgi:hypothetical protein